MPSLVASFVLTVFTICMLTHAAIHDPKPIHLLHVTRIAMAPARLDFQIRLQPIDSDRELWALLCMEGEPCSLAAHLRVESIDIEGDRAARLWSPKPWLYVEEGSYVLVAAIGPKGSIRASDQTRVQIIGP